MPLDFRQVRLSGARDERVDTARSLLVAEALDELYDGEDGRWPLARLAEVLDIPQQNEVSREERAAEMLKVWRYFSPSFREFAFRYPPAWHLLTEPARWPNVDCAEVEAFLYRPMETRGAWPTIGALRSHFGRQSNHRPEAEKTPGQETLGGLV